MGRNALMMCCGERRHGPVIPRVGGREPVVELSSPIVAVLVEHGL